MELGIIKPGTSLFDQKKKINAKIMGTESYNGWTYWHYDLNGSTVLIDNLRRKFIAEKQI